MRVEEMKDHDDGSVTVVMSATMDEITELAGEAMLAKITNAAISDIAGIDDSERVRRLKSSLTEAKLEHARMTAVIGRLRYALCRAAGHFDGANMSAEAREANTAAGEVV